MREINTFAVYNASSEYSMHHLTENFPRSFCPAKSSGICKSPFTMCYVQMRHIAHTLYVPSLS